MFCIFIEFIRASMLGHCRLGRPVYWEKTGRIDQTAFFADFTNDQLVERHIRRMEKQVC
jgi:hypothetical protein